MNKKILLVGWGYPPKIDGGLDIAVKELFEGLESRNVDVDLMLPAERAPDRENVVPVKVEGDMFSKAEQLSRAAAEKASEYDLIHTNDWFGVEAGFKASKYQDVKWVSSFHSLSSTRNRSPEPRLEKLERVGAEKADHVTAVSQRLANQVEKRYGRIPRVIYNGFSRPESSDKSLEFESPSFFFVGRHSSQKGIEHLIYGFKKFREKNSEGKLVIGGTGHMKKSFEDFVEILGIGEHVLFEGFIPEEDLEAYYRAADVFVSPSVEEPFGLTISEALNSGTKVVCTDSGINELLQPEALTLVEPDSDSIVEGLEEALEKDLPEFEKRSWNKMVEEYIQLYRGLS
ncbi:MAG: glycosyltransferase family 4 protein [Candidatus Nanohaloarchaea archaeon]